MKRIILCSILLLTIQAFVLHLYGQPLICKCGYIKLWDGNFLGSGNSQHLSDWYTFSHIIHGFIFYLIAWIIFPKSSIGFRFLFALGIEISWELIENTPAIINHYRKQALSQGYIGDSIINSLSDSISMIMGFWIAWRSPIILTVLIALGLEFWVGHEIRDNLTLNIINLIHIFPSIAKWQSGA